MAAMINQVSGSHAPPGKAYACIAGYAQVNTLNTPQENLHSNNVEMGSMDG